MDNLNASIQRYAKVGLVTLVFVLTVVQVYNAVDLNRCLLSFFTTKNAIIIKIIISILEDVLFGVLYLIIFKLVYYIITIIWIRKHRSIYVRGKWLHIHKKDDIRIGVVNIKQDFYTIGATGYNVSPNLPNYYSPNKHTVWKYLLGHVNFDETARDVTACYEAVKTNCNITNNGMHTLTISVGTDGYPIKMDGYFSDTVRIDENKINIDNHHGQLYMFRMSKEIEKYLYTGKGLNYRNLENICSNISFENEQFIIKLKSIISECKVNNNVETL